MHSRISLDPSVGVVELIGHGLQLSLVKLATSVEYFPVEAVVSAGWALLAEQGRSSDVSQVAIADGRSHGGIRIEGAFSTSQRAHSCHPLAVCVVWA